MTSDKTQKSRACVWHNTGVEASQIVSGQLTPLTIDSDDLILTRLKDGSIVCFLDQCGHQPVRLSEFGEIRDDVVMCHAHGACFNMAGSGAAMNFPARHGLVSWKAEVQDGVVVVSK